MPAGVVALCMHDVFESSLDKYICQGGIQYSSHFCDQVSSSLISAWGTIASSRDTIYENVLCYQRIAAHLI